jgi:hypothetical protein
LRETLIQRGVTRNLASYLRSITLRILSRQGKIVLPLPENRGTVGADQHTIQPIAGCMIAKEAAADPAAARRSGRARLDRVGRWKADLGRVASGRRYGCRWDGLKGAYVTGRDLLGASRGEKAKVRPATVLERTVPGCGGLQRPLVQRNVRLLLVGDPQLALVLGDRVHE